jgi:serine/threonine protein kinase
MKRITQRTKFKYEQGGIFTLDPNDFLSFGGEANVYIQPSKAIKIFKADDKFNINGFASKMEAMIPLDHPHIVFPSHIVTYKCNPVGISLPLVDGYQLLEYSEVSAWTNHGFSLHNAIDIVYQMLETIQYAHENGFILRDANPRNWMIEKKGATFEAKLIDTDSWDYKQWKSFEILESIRDTRSSHNEFNEYTDVYAWAVNAFMLLTAVHPYSGKASGYGRKEMGRRREDLVSLLNGKARPPKNFRPFDTHIPDELKPIFIKMFEEGQNFTAAEVLTMVKVSQPISLSLFVKNTTNKQTPVGGSNVTLKFTELADNVLTVNSSGIAYLSELDQGKGKVYDILADKLLILPSDRSYLHRNLEQDTFTLINHTGKNHVNFTLYNCTDLYNGMTRPLEGTPIELPSDKTFIQNNNIYNICEGKLSLIDLSLINNQIILKQIYIGEYSPHLIKTFPQGATMPYDDKNHILMFDTHNYVPITRTFSQLDSKQVLNVSASREFIYVHTFDKATGLLEDHFFTLVDNTSILINDESYAHECTVVDSALPDIVQYNNKVVWLDRNYRLNILSTKSGQSMLIPEEVSEVHRIMPCNNFLYVIQSNILKKVQTKR